MSVPYNGLNRAADAQASPEYWRPETDHTKGTIRKTTINIWGLLVVILLELNWFKINFRERGTESLVELPNPPSRHL